MIAAIYSNHGSRAWRHIDPEQHLLEACDIPLVASVLAEATGVRDGTLLAELLSRAVGGDRDAVADLGKHLAALDKSGEDLALSWIALAALDGHARSAVLMAVVCVREAASLETSGIDDVDDVLRWLRKARHWTRDLSWERWFRHAYEDYLAGASTAMDLCKDLSTVAPRESRLFLRGQSRGGDEQAKVQRTHAPDQHATPTLRVIAGIGDPESYEGRKLTRTYERLTQPLPLQGSPLAPETIADLLKRDFPWMEAVISAVHDDIMLARRAGRPWFTLAPTLLVGPPGTGKTRFARTLARLMSTGFATLDVSGQSDNRLLAGTARGWSSAQPSYPLLAMMRSDCANPIILVDEIDKAVGSHNGDVRSTLLGMLEAETARAWPDECLLGTADLSQVSWLLTANAAWKLPRPLLSRVRRIDVQRPTPDDAETLLTGLERDLAAELDCGPDRQLGIDPEIRSEFLRALRRGVDVRKVKGALRRVVAHGDGRRPTIN